MLQPQICNVFNDIQNFTQDMAEELNLKFV